MATAFLPAGFQNNAFQIDAAVGGAVDDAGHRSGGAGHRHREETRRDRRFAGQYAGYFSDREFTEYLLARLTGERSQPEAADILPGPAPRLRPLPVVVEPEADTPLHIPPPVVSGLAELELDVLELLVEAARSAKEMAVMEAVIEASIRKRNNEEALLLIAILT